MLFNNRGTILLRSEILCNAFESRLLIILQLKGGKKYTGMIPSFHLFLVLIFLTGIFQPLRVLPEPVKVDAFQSGSITVTLDQAKVHFPDGMTFSLAVGSPEKIDRITLVYSSASQVCVSQAARQDMKFDTGSNVSVEWTWDLSEGSGLPPGAEVRWHWEIHAASGETQITDEKKLVVADRNFEWQQLSQGGLTVLWAKGDAKFGAMLLREAENSLDLLAKKVGVEAPETLQIVVYPSAYDVQNATLHSPDWAGGVAFPEYNSILMGIAPEETDWAAHVIPHELTHLIVHRRIFNCEGAELPTWLDEGLAVYSEGPLDPDRVKRVRTALDDSTLPSLTTLKAGFAADAEIAEQSYGHSGMVVAYLIDQFGPEKMNALLAAVQSGSTVEAALQAVYQLGTEGVDQAWRASLGFASAPTAEESSQPVVSVEQTQVPTLALWTPIGQVPSATPEQTATPPALSTPMPGVTAVPAVNGSDSAFVTEADRMNNRLIILLAGIIFVVGAAFVVLLVVYFFVIRK
jgi:hypothetical protein